MNRKSLGERLRPYLPQFRKVRLPNTDVAALILCGESRVNPVTIRILQRLFPGRQWNFVLVGRSGKHCRADITDASWPQKCFGDFPKFPVCVQEYCDRSIHSRVKIQHLVREQGIFVVLGPTQGMIYPGFRFVPEVSSATVHVFVKN